MFEYDKSCLSRIKDPNKGGQMHLGEELNSVFVTLKVRRRALNSF